jgi:hypothetical protein
MKTKAKYTQQLIDTDSLPAVLRELKAEKEGLNVPVGYFDSLNPRIVDRINQQKNSSIFSFAMPIFKKPVIWVPALASIVLAVMLIINFSSTQNQPNQLVDELTDMNIAYDVSYAEEALLAEAQSIDNELERAEMDYPESVMLSDGNEPTADEITEYLKMQDIDPEILNQN